MSPSSLFCTLLVFLFTMAWRVGLAETERKWKSEAAQQQQQQERLNRSEIWAWRVGLTESERNLKSEAAQQQQQQQRLNRSELWAWRVGLAESERKWKSEAAQQQQRLNRSELWVGNGIVVPPSPPPSFALSSFRSAAAIAMAERSRWMNPLRYVWALRAFMRALRIPPGSFLAKHMLQTVSTCAASTRGVGEAMCFASPHHMARFARARLGHHHAELLHGIEHDDGQREDEWRSMEGKTTMMRRMMVGAATSVSTQYVVCEKLSFPFALFHCKPVQDEHGMELVMLKLILPPSPSPSNAGKREMNRILQCGMSRGGEEEGECEWVGEGSLVWAKREEDLSSPWQDQTQAWRNEKLSFFGNLGKSIDNAWNKATNYFHGVGDAISGHGN